MEKLLSSQEVCKIVGCSSQTLNNWYKFKRENPKHELSKLLPDYILEENEIGRPRKWRASDVTKFFEFREKMPTGRKGVMGSVTQKYQK